MWNTGTFVLIEYIILYCLVLVATKIHIIRRSPSLFSIINSVWKQENVRQKITPDNSQSVSVFRIYLMEVVHTSTRI